MTCHEAFKAWWKNASGITAATAFSAGYEAGIIEERERCAKIAEAVDSRRGNENFIAEAIRTAINPPQASAPTP